MPSGSRVIPPIETFAVSRAGLLRRVRLADGRVVETLMGHAGLRRGETLDQRADRAFLSSRTRPEVSGRRSAVRVFDLYSGCGGFSLGFAEACRATGRRFVPVAALDIDAAAIATYARNLKPRFAIRDDATELIDGRFGGRLTGLERWLHQQVGSIDILLAGPPCQGFSALNNHTRGEDPKNRLYEHVARTVEVLEPQHVLIENVASVGSYSPAAIRLTVRRLSKLGYTVSEGVVAVGRLGIPQFRRRHVLIATVGTKIDHSAVIREFHRTPRDLRWAIGDLIGLRSKDDFDRPAAPTSENEKRMRYLREQKAWDLPDHLRPPCHRDFEHSYKSMYGRLHWDRPAQTITSGYGSMGQGRYVHPRGDRTITPHEAARLQFFPDWFDFGPGPRTVWATLIGNAVPMKLSYVFGVWLLR